VGKLQTTTLMFVVRGRPPVQRLPGERDGYLHSKLLEGEKPHPANYRGCRHAKEELQKKKTQRTPNTTTGRVFSSNLTTTSVSFAAALRGRTAQQQDPQARQVPVADRVAGMQVRKPAPRQQQQTSGQSFRAQNVNIQPLDNMFIVVTVV
jgi:hypothetical protein